MFYLLKCMSWGRGVTEYSNYTVSCQIIRNEILHLFPECSDISHVMFCCSCRFFYMSYSIFCFFKLRPDDVIYDTLPLYHTNGGVLSIGNCLLQGCTVVIRKKFSASRFWEDCMHHQCTVSIVL